MKYSAELSEVIYAGADLFLMPSGSEPCGLSQMIAMRYGTVPVVRETGGLKDSVVPYNRFDGTGTGFSFRNIDWRDMMRALEQAAALWKDDKEMWKTLQVRGMTADLSWDRSAARYTEVYESLAR